MGETSMIGGSGTQATPPGDAPQVRSQAVAPQTPETTDEQLEMRGLFVRVTASGSPIGLRVDTRLLSEQEMIERDNETIRRRGRGS
jgi:hypothetical protein